MEDINSYPCPNFNGGVTKRFIETAIKVREWMTNHILRDTVICLPTYALISENLC